jgi:mitochondrial import inner membrane translocase subunit TIM17
LYDDRPTTTTTTNTFIVIIVIMPRQAGLADREPCPWRIVDDVGGAFCMGNIGGGIWHSIKGARMAPAGARWAGSLSAVQARAPVLGGQFAVWGGLFACCDCSLTAIRQKEDPWNSIASGAATGGILAARAGPRAMATAAIFGGVILALIEGMGIMFTKIMAQPSPDEVLAQQARMDPTAPPTQGGLFPSSFYPSATTTAPSAPTTTNTSTTAPPMSMSSDPYHVDTTFSTESSSSSNSDSSSSSSSSSWWPFGSEKA